MRPEPMFVPGELVLLADSLRNPELIGGCFTVQDVSWVAIWDTSAPAGWGYRLDAFPHCDGGRLREVRLRKIPGNLLGDMSSLAGIWTPKLDEVKA